MEIGGKIMDKQIIEVKAPTTNFGPVESYKTLRTNLLYTENLHVISVTSSSPDEGKTVTAFNLANSFAQMGKKVCLVDCDLRRSSLKNYLLIRNKHTGVSEYLTRQAENYVRATNIDNLYIVLSGKKPPNPSELLSSASFNDLVIDLRKAFDYVIIDSPPVTVAMDAAIIGRAADGVILVVRNEHTKRNVVKRAKIELERNGSRIVGVVLNRVSKSQMEYGSYYGYNKYY